MANDIVQTIAEARIDARSLSEFVFKPANFIVSRRLAPSINTLQYYVDKAKSVNDAFSKSVSDATAAADIAISAANTANQNAIGLIDSVTSQASQSVQNAIRDVAIDANLVTDALTTISPLSGGATARTQLDKNRESVSVLDFFTPAELASYYADPNFDANRPLQAFFTHITNNDVGVAYCTGAYQTSKTIIWGGKDSATKTVIGNFNLVAKVFTDIDTLFKIQPGRYCRWIGGIVVSGRGSITWSNRTVKRGLHFGGEYSAAHFTLIGTAEANGGFSEIGIHVDNLCTGSNLGSLQATRCASGYSVSGYSVVANFSNRVDNADTGYAQRSTVTVDNLPPENLKTPLMMAVDGKPDIYYVDVIDRTNNTIKVSPTIDLTAQTGKLRYIFGAGVYVWGPDTSAIKINKISGTANGIVAWLAALYLPVVDNLTAEQNAAGLAIGNSLTSSNLGGQINGLYVESNDNDMIKLTRSALLNLPIVATYAFNHSKIAFPATLRKADNTTTKENEVLNGILIQTRGYFNTVEGASNNFGGSVNLDVTSENRSMVNAWGNGVTINISTPNMALHNAYGYHTREVLVIRPLGDGTPTSGVIINAPIGYTVNGESQITFNGFVRAPKFTVSLIVATKDFIVTTADVIRSNFSVSTLPELASGAQQSLTIALAGALIGDPVMVNFNKDLKGTRLWGEVTATGVVTAYHRNDTGVTYPATTGALRVKAL